MARDTEVKYEAFLLQVSDAAVSVLEEERDAQQLPGSFGVRLFAQPDDSGEAQLALAFAQEPEDGDQVTVQNGTEVYVAEELAEPLAAVVLDIEQTSDGPQLSLVPQDDEEG